MHGPREQWTQGETMITEQQGLPPSVLSGALAAELAIGELLEPAPFVPTTDTLLTDPRLNLYGRSRNLFQTYGFTHVRDIFVVGPLYAQKIARIGEKKRNELIRVFGTSAPEMPSPSYVAQFCTNLEELNPYAVLHNILAKMGHEGRVEFTISRERRQQQLKVTWDRIFSRTLEPGSVACDGEPDLRRFYSQYRLAFRDFAQEFVNARTEIEARNA